MSGVPNNVDTNDRPKVTSVKVRTRPGSDRTVEDDSIIDYYTGGQVFSEYSESLLAISGIKILNGNEHVEIPLGPFFPATDGEEGFAQAISEETKGELASLIGEVNVKITFETRDVPMGFE